MHQFGWLSERGGNFFNLLQKERGGGGGEGGAGAFANPGENYVSVVKNCFKPESAPLNLLPLSSWFG